MDHLSNLPGFHYPLNSNSIVRASGCIGGRMVDATGKRGGMPTWNKYFFLNSATYIYKPAGDTVGLV